MLASIGIHDLAIYMVACFVLYVTPGPDTFLILTRSTTMGARAGMVAMAGIVMGGFVHIIAATVGLSAVLAASATAFTIIKWVGAAYLVIIGIQMLLAKATAAPLFGSGKAYPYGTIFMQGFLSNALNPKVAVFFLAFLPQFIDPASEQKALAFFVLGCLFNLGSVFWNSFTAITSAKFASFIKEPNAALWINRSGGACFLGFGIKLAMTEK